MESTTTRCPFCGSELVPRYVVLGSRSVRIGHVPCGCSGAAAEARMRFEREEAARRLRDEESRAACCERAGVPPRYLEAETDREDLVSAVMAGEGLYIQGPFGCGKTHLAMAIAKRALAAGRTARVTSSMRILAQIRGAYGGGADEGAVFRSLANPWLLVIDDLGKDAPTEWAVSMLYRVVNERYEQMRPTVVTSNYSKRELVDRLTVKGDSSTAEALVSRLFEMTRKVELSGEDRRLK